MEVKNIIAKLTTSPPPAEEIRNSYTEMAIVRKELPWYKGDPSEFFTKILGLKGYEDKNNK